jgi:hypothetical protein
MTDSIKCWVHLCDNEAVWNIKSGWNMAPGAAQGPVCEDHHCWEPITQDVDKLITDDELEADDDPDS